MTNKVLISLYVPSINKSYDIYVPVNKRVHDVINMVISSLVELTKGDYAPGYVSFYNLGTGTRYSMNSLIRDTDIRNNTRIVLM